MTSQMHSRRQRQVLQPQWRSALGTCSACWRATKRHPSSCIPLLTIHKRILSCFAAAMEERLGYTQRMLARHQKTTIIPEAGTGNQNRSNNAYLNRSPAGPESSDVAAENRNGSHVGGPVALPVRISHSAQPLLEVC